MSHSHCLDGRALTAFLDERRPRLEGLDPVDRRALRRWRRGQPQVREATAERILLRLGIHLWEIPDSCYRSYDNGRSGWRKATA